MRTFTTPPTPDKTLLNELSYKQLVLLAQAFENWATSPMFSPEQVTELLNNADKIRSLSKEVDRDWSPPEPEKLSILAFIVREIEAHTRSQSKTSWKEFFWTNFTQEHLECVRYFKLKQEEFEEKMRASGITVTEMPPSNKFVVTFPPNRRNEKLSDNS